jgi:phosphoglycolate phosphatase-like HAD superfamily hydrolase
MTKLVLFDVDGTLILTGRAGVRAMTLAFRDVFGVDDGFAHISMAGLTDSFLLASALSRAGRASDDSAMARFHDAYVAHLAVEVFKPGQGRKGLMPGVRELLETLAPRDDIFLALLTGNFAEAARIKLQYFDLWRYFRCGAYGDDASDRNALVPIALSRARGCGSPRSFDRVLVVGDTPHDVACAAAAGATSIAVATGNHNVDELRAAGADAVFEDFRDLRAFLRVLDWKAPFDSA